MPATTGCGYNPGGVLGATCPALILEALKALPAGQRNTAVAAKQGLEFCNRLFAIEREINEATPEERYRTRLERSRPIMEAFSAWLKQQSPRVLPKSAFGQAISYCRNQLGQDWEAFWGGRLELGQ
jgi:hypothetical protein